MIIYEPKECITCKFGDHEAWCLLPGDDKERYYLPREGISENCPLGKLEPKKCRKADGVYRHFQCPTCKNYLIYEQKYCEQCGQRIKWVNEFDDN